jgi:hypothetical protein
MRRGNSVTKLLVTAIAAQVLVFLIVAIVPIGFDHPSALGLAYQHFLILLLLHCAALIIGVGVTIQRRSWTLTVIQLAAAFVFISQLFPVPWGPLLPTDKKPIVPAEEQAPSA